MGSGLVSVQTGEQTAICGVRRFSTSIPLLAPVFSSSKQNECCYIISAYNLWIICLERQSIGTIWFHCTAVNTRQNTPVGYLRTFFFKGTELKRIAGHQMFWFWVQDLRRLMPVCEKLYERARCEYLWNFPWEGVKWASSSCFEWCSVHICTSWNGVVCGLKPCWHFKHII